MAITRGDASIRTRAPPRSAWLRAALSLAARPRLWSTAVVQVGRLAPSGWWRRPPFLPRPDPAYVAFRLATQYGARGADELDPRDVVAYLEWCRTSERA